MHDRAKPDECVEELHTSKLFTHTAEIPDNLIDDSEFGRWLAATNAAARSVRGTIELGGQLVANLTKLRGSVRGQQTPRAAAADKIRFAPSVER